MTTNKKQQCQKLTDQEQQNTAAMTTSAIDISSDAGTFSPIDYFKSGPVVFFTWTTKIGEWQVVHVSSNIQNVLGYTQEEMMSAEMPYGNYMHPEDKARVMEEAKEFRKSQTPHYVQTYRYKHKEGDYRWVEDYNVPEYDEDGKAHLIRGYVIDVTDRHNAEAVLKESEQKYRTIVDHINDALFIHDLNGIILDVNQHACDMLGYEKEEFIGFHVSKIQYNMDNERTASILKQLKEEGKVVFESTDRHKNGTPIPVEVSTTLVSREGSGTVQSISRDITERKQAEMRLRKSEAQFRKLFEHTPVTLMVHHKDTGEVLDANPAAYLTYGFHSLEAMQANDIWLDPPYSREDALKWLKKASEEGLQTFEWKSQRVDGEYFWEQVHLIPIDINDEQHILAANTNITVLKRAEEELTKANMQLQAATNAAKAANYVKDQFLANMSHELRTPLNGVMGMIQLLQTTDLTEEQMEYLDLSLQSCHGITAVVEDVLNYTNLENHTQHIVEEPLQLNELLWEIMGLHQTAAIQKNLQLIVHPNSNIPNGLVGDRLKLKQILGNLVGNAVKFTKEGAVYLSARQEIATTSDGRILISFQVKDTGIGIDPDKMDYIFQKFSQADESHTREYGGLGLGLSIAAKLADIIGGKITAESTPGEGSTFTLTCEMGLYLED